MVWDICVDIHHSHVRCQDNWVDLIVPKLEMEVKNISYQACEKKPNLYCVGKSKYKW